MQIVNTFISRLMSFLSNNLWCSSAEEKDTCVYSYILSDKNWHCMTLQSRMNGMSHPLPLGRWLTAEGRLAHWGDTSLFQLFQLVFHSPTIIDLHNHEYRDSKLLIIKDMHQLFDFIIELLFRSFFGEFLSIDSIHVKSLRLFVGQSLHLLLSLPFLHFGLLTTLHFPKYMIINLNKNKKLEVRYRTGLEPV